MAPGTRARLPSHLRSEGDPFQEEGNERMRRPAVLAALAAVAMVLIATAPALADNHPPSGATFSWLPATPRGGDDVTFTATAKDGDGDALIYRWDLDDSGTYETTGRVVTTRMARGKRKVRLVVSDLWGAS